MQGGNKDFLVWHKEKEKINSQMREFYFREREVWWCSLGLNIGDEQDGKGVNFRRPVVILRKFNKNIFLGIPLSSKVKEGIYHFKFYLSTGILNTALLSQIKLFDSRRLLDKLGYVSYIDHSTMQKKIADIICPQSNYEQSNLLIRKPEPEGHL